jgi:hypothetical protein
MLWKLFGYIFLWMAFFSIMVTLFLIIAKKSKASWVKKMAARFGGEFAETVEVRQGFFRFGVFFGAIGTLLLLSSPSLEPAGESPFNISFTEAGLVLVILWQGKNLWEMARAGKEKKPVKQKKKKIGRS